MRILALALVLGTITFPTRADELRLPPNPTYRAECGTCHVAYPPRLLPAEAWQRLMSRLDRHFGSDASLDKLTQDEIERFLVANAGRRPAPRAEEPRITETAWFRKEHDEIPSALWRSAKVGSAANCAACHTRAEDGDYSKRTRRVPQ